MVTGTVKSWDEHRGFGFLTTADGVDVVVHAEMVDSARTPRLHVGQRVDFDVVQGATGPTAENVRGTGEGEPFPGTVQRHVTPRESVSGAATGRAGNGLLLSNLPLGSVDLSLLVDCIGCEIMGADTVEKRLDEIIRLEGGERFRITDFSDPLLDEGDEVLVLRDREAGVYRIVTDHEVIEVRRIRPKT